MLLWRSGMYLGSLFMRRVLLLSTHAHHLGVAIHSEQPGSSHSQTIYHAVVSRHRVAILDF